MPRFFIPAARDEADAERVYEATVRFAEASHGRISPDRIFSIDYTHNGRRHHDEVGKANDLTGEVVVAILHVASGEGLYLVCSASRGVLRGEPFLVSAGRETTVAGFTADDPQD